MKKIGAFFLFFVGALFVYNGYTSDDYSVSNFWEWVQSLMTRAQLKIGSSAEQLTGSANAQEIAANLIANFEGFRAKAYNDAGKLAIGYGHDIVPGDGFDSTSVITEADAHELLLSDMDIAMQCVENFVTVPMTPNQEAALISLCYNIGCGAFQKSTLLDAFNNGDAPGASDQFSVWIYSNGQVNQTLVSRRAQEQSVFNS